MATEGRSDTSSACTRFVTTTIWGWTASRIERAHTVGWIYVGSREWIGIQEHKRHMHHALQRPVLPIRRPRTFGLIGKGLE